MKILEKALIPVFLLALTLTSCDSFRPSPIFKSTSTLAVTETLTANPAITFTDTPSPLPSSELPTDISSQTSEKIAYYYFVDIAKEAPPEGSVVINPGTYILAPTLSEMTYSPDTAKNLKTALEAVLNDGRNGWISNELEIVEASFDDGHANVVLQGKYFGVGDVTLVAAGMQILMTVFADPSVQTAVITLNGNTIANLGISQSMNAKPADYVFTRAEIVTYMNEHTTVLR